MSAKGIDSSAAGETWLDLYSTRRVGTNFFYRAKPNIKTTGPEGRVGTSRRRQLSAAVTILLLTAACLLASTTTLPPWPAAT